MIAKRIKEIREKNGLNKKEMSARLELPYTTYNNYETGNREPGSDFLIKFSKEFNISIDYLMGNDVQKQEFIELYKKNDILTDIVLKLQSDDEFREITETIYNASPELLNALKAFIFAFKQ